MIKKILHVLWTFSLQDYWKWVWSKTEVDEKVIAGAKAAVAGKIDTLEGLKENVIVGHRIPAGTGMRDYDNIIVGSKEEYSELMAGKEEFNY